LRRALRTEKDTINNNINNTKNPKPQSPIGVVELMLEAVFGFVRTVLESMMGHVALPSIMRKITNDHQNDTIQEFRETIQGMLDTYSYEASILKTANNLLNGDMYRSLYSHHKRRTRAFTPRSNSCGVCMRQLSDFGMSPQLYLFDCGHTFHESCFSKNQSHSHCLICTMKSKRKEKKKVSAKPETKEKEKKEEKGKEPDVNEEEENKKPKMYDDQRTKQYVVKLQLAQSRQQGDDTDFKKFTKTLEILNNNGGNEGVSLHLAPVREKNRKTPIHRNPGALPRKAEHENSIGMDDGDD